MTDFKPSKFVTEELTITEQIQAWRLMNRAIIRTEYELANPDNWPYIDLSEEERELSEEKVLADKFRLSTAISIERFEKGGK